MIINFCLFFRSYVVDYLILMYNISPFFDSFNIFKWLNIFDPIASSDFCFVLLLVRAFPSTCLTPAGNSSKNLLSFDFGSVCRILWIYECRMREQPPWFLRNHGVYLYWLGWDDLLDDLGSSPGMTFDLRKGGHYTAQGKWSSPLWFLFKI